MLKDIIVEEAEVTIVYQKGQAQRKPWITGEMNQMIQEMGERRKRRHQSTEEAKREYRRLNNKLRRMTKKAREQWWEGQYTEIEELQRKGRHDKVYEIMKNSTKKPTQRGGMSVQVVACRGCWMPGANEILGCPRKYFLFVPQNF